MRLFSLYTLVRFEIMIWLSIRLVVVKWEFNPPKNPDHFQAWSKCAKLSFYNYSTSTWHSTWHYVWNLLPHETIRPQNSILSYLVHFWSVDSPWRGEWCPTYLSIVFKVMNCQRFVSRTTPPKMRYNSPLRLLHLHVPSGFPSWKK